MRRGRTHSARESNLTLATMYSILVPLLDRTRWRLRRKLAPVQAYQEAKELAMACRNPPTSFPLRRFFPVSQYLLSSVPRVLGALSNMGAHPPCA